MCIFGRARASSLVETTEKKVSRGGVKKKKNQTTKPRLVSGNVKHFLRPKERFFSFVRRCLQAGKTASEL